MRTIFFLVFLLAADLMQASPLRSSIENYLTEHEPIRHALVIGNANYKHMGRMDSAEADAKSVARDLTALNFNVMQCLNVSSVRQFEDEILPSFRKKINIGDLVLFYFSGHGFAHGPHNFIAPVDMPLTIKKEEIVYFAISTEGVEDYLSKRQPGLLLMLIDACRSIAGFKITAKNNLKIIPKGMSIPLRYNMNINTLVGYATRFGTIALGSNVAQELSPFTKSLIAHIATQDREFGAVFNEISVDVRVETDEYQHPGLFDWSDTDLYLNPTDLIKKQQKEAWLVALDSQNKKIIKRFLYRHSVSKYAAAARKWLSENEDNSEVLAYTLVSPAAVERAWRPSGESRVAIIPSADGFAFNRYVDFNESKQVKDLDDSQLGLVPSGTRCISEAKLNKALKAHANVVTTKDYKARLASSLSHPDTMRVPFGTTMKIEEKLKCSPEADCLRVRIPNELHDLYIDLKAFTPLVRPVELGQSLLEIIAEPQNEGIKDLIDPQKIKKAITDLKKEGRSITWVSIATAMNDDINEAVERASRLLHTKYLLKKYGIDGRRITSVTNIEDFHGDGVRLRFFGY